MKTANVLVIAWTALCCGLSVAPGNGASAAPNGEIKSVQVLALTTDSVYVKWIYDAGDVDHFRVELYRGHAPPVSAESLVKNKTVPGWYPKSEVFSGLMAGQTYTATVLACLTASPDTCGNRTYGTGNPKPFAPEHFLASPSTKSSLSLSWNQSGVITEYVLQARLDEVEQSGFNFTWASVPEAGYAGYVAGLGKSGANYTLVLTAVSDNVASDAANAMATTYLATPDSFVARPYTTTSLYLAWLQKDDDITSYGLDVSLNGLTQSGFNFTYYLDSTTLEGYVTNLSTPGGDYTLVLTAYRGDLTGIATSTCASYLSLPTNFTAAAHETTTAFRLEWIGIVTHYHMDVWLGGQPQKGFNFTYSYDNGIYGMKFYGNVVNLGTPGGTYTLVLTASFDEKPTGSDNVTVPTYPPGPSALHCSATNSSVTLTISDPAIDSDFVVETYTIGFISLNPARPFNATRNVPYSPSSTTYAVGGLTSGVSYRAVVYSHSNTLRSAGSVSATCTTDLEAPITPDAEPMIDGTNLLYVTWQPPINTNIYFDQYVVSCQSKYNVSTVSVTTLTLSAVCYSLTPGTLYTVTVATVLHASSGDTAPAVSLPTQVFTAPLTPTIYLSRLSTSVIVTLTYPLKEPRCSYYLISTQPASETINASCDAESVELKSLIDNTYYTVEAQAFATNGRLTSGPSGTAIASIWSYSPQKSMSWIAGVVVGGVLFVGIVAVVGYIVWRRHHPPIDSERFF